MLGGPSPEALVAQAEARARQQLKDNLVSEASGIAFDARGDFELALSGSQRIARRAAAAQAREDRHTALDDALAKASTAALAQSNGDAARAWPWALGAVLALRSDAPASIDSRLRNHLIALARQLGTPVPEAVQEHALRGRALIKAATEENAFDKAAEAFRAGLRLAPWWPAGYALVAVALDKSGRAAEAARNFRLHLAASPDAPRRRDIERKVAELEATAESVAAVQALEGDWASAAGSVLHLRARDAHVALTFVHPSDEARKAGWIAGETLLDGAFKGKTFEGTLVARFGALKGDARRCLGDRMNVKVTAVEARGRALVVRYRAQLRDRTSCQTFEEVEGEHVLKRVVE